jgi:hypothetical protein
MIKYNNSYESFDEHLDLDFGKMDLKTKEELKTVMQNYNYHLKRDKKTKILYKAEPSQKQLTYAWTHLKKEGTMDLRENREYRQERGKTRRAIKTVYINGKKYNPGQYLPRE